MTPDTETGAGRMETGRECVLAIAGNTVIGAGPVDDASSWFAEDGVTEVVRMPVEAAGRYLYQPWPGRAAALATSAPSQTAAVPARDSREWQAMVCVDPAGEPYWHSVRSTEAESRRACFGACNDRRTDELTREGWRCLPVYLAPPAVPDGHVVVPIEPTEAMHIAAADWSRTKYGKPIGLDASDGCWKAMIRAAAPQTEEA